MANMTDVKPGDAVEIITAFAGRLRTVVKRVTDTQVVVEEGRFKRSNGRRVGQGYGLRIVHEGDPL